MSVKTVAQKLLLKPGTSVWLSHPDRVNLIEPLPEDVQLAPELEEASVGLVFTDDEASLRAILDAQKERLAQPNILWVAYPKANRIAINRDSLWPILTEYGMRPNGQVAIDDVWSALRFRPIKEGEAPFTGGRK